jgi:hypothetical protein
MEYSISQALAELTLLQKRIIKETNNFLAVDIVKGKGKNVVKSNLPITDFEKNVTSAYQKINDLINRRKKIQSAIMKSNAQTIVKINNEEMTVVDALALKENIKFSQNLLEQITRTNTARINDMEIGNRNVEANLQRLLESQFGKDNTNDNADEMKKIESFYQESNSYKLIDPLNVSELIKKLDENIDNFENTIDYILSTSNATTTIIID